MVRISTSETIMMEGARRFLTANFMARARTGSRDRCARRHHRRFWRGGLPGDAAVIEFGEQISHERFHFYRQHFHLLGKINECDQTRHGNAEAEDGGAEGFRYSERDSFCVGCARTQTETGK